MLMRKMKAELDEVDKEILNHICEGASSLSEIGDKCGLSHNTISRRVNKLEENGFIKERMMATPHFEKIGYSAVIAGISIGLGENIEKALETLNEDSSVRFLWKTFGEHDLVAVLLCNKEKIGECIENVRKELVNAGIELEEIDLSTSTSWEKLKLAP